MPTAKTTTSKKATPAAPKPKTKLAELRELWAAGEYRRALKLAAGWQRLGPHKEVITRGWDAVGQPENYRAMGHDPDELYAAALAACAARWKLPPAMDAEAPEGAPAKKTKAAEEEEPGPKAPGVRAKATRPYLAGTIIKKYGLAAGVTPAMVAELDEAYGKPNPTESTFCLKAAWHACRAYAGAAPGAAS